MPGVKSITPISSRIIKSGISIRATYANMLSLLGNFRHKKKEQGHGTGGKRSLNQLPLSSHRHCEGQNTRGVSAFFLENNVWALAEDVRAVIVYIYRELQGRNLMKSILNSLKTLIRD